METETKEPETTEPETQSGAALKTTALKASPKAAMTTALTEPIQSGDTTISITSDVEKVIIDMNDNAQLMITTQKSDGTDSTVTVYTNTATITSMSINVKDMITFGENISKASVDNPKTLNMSLADIILWAQQVLLVTDGNFTWNVKSLDVKAAPAEPDTLNPVSSYIENTYKAHEYEVQIKNTSINASGDINILATNKARKHEDTDNTEDVIEVDSASDAWNALKDKADQAIGDLKSDLKDALNDATDGSSFFVTVKPITTKVSIENSQLSASDIRVNTNTKVHVTTKSIGIGLAVNVVLADSQIHVKDSVLKATGRSTQSSTGNATNILPKGTISILAKTDVNVTGNATAGAGNFGIAVAVVLGDTFAKVEGSELTAAGDIEVAADNHTLSTAAATGKKKNEKQSGVYVGVSVVLGDTYAAVTDSTKKSNLTAAEDLRVISNRYGTTTTTAVSQLEKYAAPATNELDASVNRIVTMVKQSLMTVVLEKADGVKQIVGNYFNESDILGKLKAAFSSAGSEDGLSPDAEEEENAGTTNGGIKFTFKMGNATESFPGNVKVTIKPDGISGQSEVIWNFGPGNVSKSQTNFKPGKYIIVFEVPNNYEKISDLKVTVKPGKLYTKEIVLKEVNYDKNQLVGSAAVAVVTTTNKAYIESEGTMTAGGRVTVEANGISNTTTRGDASFIDSVFNTIVPDGSIWVSMTTPNQSEVISTQIHLEKKGGETVGTGTVSSSQKYVAFPSSIGDNGQSALTGLKAGTYVISFYIDTTKVKVDTTKYKQYTSKPSWVSADDWIIQNREYYYYEVELKTATRMMKDSGGKVLYDPFGKPIITEYVKGIFEIITVTPSDSTGDTEAKKVSAGVGISVNVINNSNEAYIKNATVKAGGLTVKASDGIYKAYDGKTTLQNSISSVAALAGYSSGNFGMAGAVAVNVTNNHTKALLDNAKIIISASKGSIIIDASSATDVTTTASGTSGKGAFSTVGVGTGIAVSVHDESVEAEISGSTTSNKEGTGSVGNITVSADSQGTTTASATAGTKGGKSIAPVVVVNIFGSDTTAKLPSGNGSSIIQTVGNVTVSAVSKRRKVSSGSAAAAGSQVAVGGAVVVDVASMNQSAVISRNISGAGNITVHALGQNSSETSSQAGANGAAEKSDKKKNEGGSSDSSESVGNPSADDLVNKALSSGKEIGGSNSKAASAAPEQSPQKAETTEGSVNVAGAVSVSIWNDVTEALLSGTTNCTGLLHVNAETCETLDVSADASATISSTGVGVTVAILVADVTNHALVTGTHSAARMRVEAIMPQVDVYDTKTGAYAGQTEGVNTVSVSSASGAGASNVGVAGAVAINIYTADYKASSANATLTGAGESKIHSRIRHNITTKAGASEDLAAAGTGNSGDTKKTGIGASFAMTIADVKSNAFVAANSTVSSKGSLKVLAEAINGVQTNAIAGEDGYAEKGVPGKVQFVFVDGNGAKVTSGVQIKVGMGNPQTVDSTGIYTLEAEMGKEYTITIVSVGSKYQTPKTTVYKFILGADGFKRTIVLYEKGKEAKDQYASVDAAVALNIVSSETKAEIGSGSVLELDGSLTIHAEGTTNTTAESKGSAKASNVAVGGSVAVNLVDELVAALFNGKATIGGNAAITAESNSKDVASAYATASGLQLDRLKDKFNTDLSGVLSGFQSKPSQAKNPTNIASTVDGVLYGKGQGTSTMLSGTNGSLMMKVLEALGVKTTETSVNTGTTATTTDSTTSGGAVSAGTVKNEAASGTTGSTTEKETKVTVAAAVGVNVSEHVTEAKANGTIQFKNNGSSTVTVKATNNNNFKALGTGAAVTSDTAVALGVAVVVNTSKALAELTGIIGSENAKAGNVLVQADTNLNLSDDFKDDIAAQAIAGAGKGSESGGAAVAGAVAVFVNDAENKASIGNNSKLYANGSVKVLANEKSKLAIRAWGASISNSLFNEQNSNEDGTGKAVGGSSAGNANQPDSKGSGVGAAFAVLYANSKTEASVGNDVYIMADSLDVIAQKLRVSSGDYRFDGIQLNGQITIGTNPQKVIQINTTKEANSRLPLKFNDVFNEGLSLLNVLASKNYYVEAAGGSVADNSSFSGAGSFAVIVMNDSVTALIGDNVTLILDGGANVKASSDINMVTIGGALAYGNKTGAGISSTVIVNNGETLAVIGDGLNFTGSSLTVDADANMDVLTLLVAASVGAKDHQDSSSSNPTALNGVVNVYVSDMDITAGIGEDAIINASGDVTVHANHTLNHVGVVGGASLSNGLGAGASTGVIVINQDVLAYLAQGAQVKANNVRVLADQNSKLYEIIVNGALAAGSDAKAAVAVSPAVHVIKNSTKAYLGAPKANGEAIVTKGSVINAKNNVEVKATDKTFILVLSGGAAVSSQHSGVGGSVQVNVFLKDVTAQVGTGSETAFVTIYAPGTLEISGLSEEEIYSIVVGLGGGSKASVSGSVDVLVLSNQVLAKLGDHARVGSTANKGNVIVSASDSLKQAAAAGAITVSTGGAAVGLANVDVIIDGSAEAILGAGTVIYAKDVSVLANSKNDLVSVSIGGGVSTGDAAATGSVVVIVLDQTVKALVDSNAKIYTDGQVKVNAASNTELVDAVGSLGVGTGAVVGASVDTVVFGGKTLAVVEKGVLINAGGNIYVTADAVENLTNVVIGISAGTGSAAVSGSVAVIVKQQLVAAVLGHMDEKTLTVDGTDVDIATQGSLQVTATENSDLLVVAGSLAATSGSAGIGAGVIVVTDEHITWAEIGKSAIVDAMGKGTPLTGPFGTVTTTDIIANSGNAELNYKKKKRGDQSVYGILVGAYTNSTLNLVAVSAAGSGTAGVGAAAATLVESEKTIARINTSAKINTRSRESGAKASVHVVSTADTSESVAGGGAAIGGTAGVSAAIVTFIGNKETLAQIANGCIVVAEQDIVVQALSSTSLYVNGVGFAVGGTAGVGATSTVLVMQDITKAEAGGTLTANQGSILVVADADELLQLSATSVSGSGTAGVGAAIGVLVFKGETIAKVLGGSTLTAGKDIKVTANSNEDVIMTVIGVSGGGSAGVSGSVAALIMNVVTQAIIDDASASAKGSVTAGGNIVVSAKDATNFILATGGLAAGGAAGVGTAIEVAVYRNTVTAKVGNYNILEGASISVLAEADRKLDTYAVMAGAGGTAAVNGSILVLSIGTGTSDSDVDDIDGQKGLSADTSKEASERGQAAADQAFGQQLNTGSNNPYIDFVNDKLSGLNSSNKNLVSGYFTQANVEDKTAAMIGNGGETTSTAEDILVHATEKTSVTAAAGSVSASGTVSVGVSANIVLIAGTVDATLGGTVRSAGNVSVQAKSELKVPVFTAVGGGAGAVAANGTVTVLKVTSAALAKINALADILAENNVIVYAGSDADILAVNGNVGGAGAAAVGAAVNIIIFKNQTMAAVEAARIQANAKGNGVSFINGEINSSINKDQLPNSEDTETDSVSSTAVTSVQKGALVGAHSTQKIRNWVVAAGGAGAASVMGSVNLLIFDETTKAYIKGTEVVVNGTNADIAVIAVDNTSIQNVAGNVSGAGTVAVGIGSDTIKFSKKVLAVVENAVLTSKRHILILANSREDILSVVVSTGGAGVVAVNSSDSVVVMENTTEALVKDSILTADGSILITAEDEQDYVVTAGSANGSGTAGVGAGVVVITSSNTVKAHVSGNSSLDALGLAGVNTYDGTMSGSGRERRRNKSTQYGIIIGAFNWSDLFTLAFAASGSGAVSAAAASVTVISKAVVTAQTDKTVQLNRTEREGRSPSCAVKILALDASSEDVDGGGAAVGGVAGVSAVVVVTVMDKQVSAIGGGSIYAPGGITIQADSYDSAQLAAAGIGGGFVGATGTASTFKYQSRVIAKADGTLESGGAVKILASMASDVVLAAGSLSAGGVAAGASVVVFLFNGTTKAYVAEGSSVTAASLNITATSSEKLNAVSTAGGIGGGAVSISGLVVIAEAVTQAYTEKNVTLNISGTASIKATDTLDYTLSALTANIGGVAAGGAVIVLIFKNTVTAQIGSGNMVNAGDLNILATADRKLDVNAGAGGTGVGAVSGSVVVISIGAPINGADDKKALGTLNGTAQESVNGSLSKAQLSIQDDRDGQDIRTVANGYFNGITIDLSAYFNAASLLNKVLAAVESGSTVKVSGNVNVKADDKTTLSAVSGTLSGGALAAGGSVLITHMNGNTESYVGGTVTGQDTNDLTVSSSQNITTSKFEAKTGTAGAVGLGAAVAWLDITGINMAYMLADSNISVFNMITVEAKQTINSNPRAIGASAGAVAAGVATAKLIVKGTNRAELKSGNISGKQLIVRAIQDIRTNVTTTAAAGGFFGSGTGAVALVEVTGTNEALSAADLNITGAAKLAAITSMNANVTASGLAASVTGSVGIPAATLTVSPKVHAYITGGISNVGSMQLLAYFNVNENGSNITGNQLSVTVNAGAAAGLASVTVNIAKLVVSGEVKALMQGGNLTASGDVEMYARVYLKENLVSKALNVAGGAAVGVSRVEMTENMTTEAGLTGGSLSANNIKITAYSESVNSAKATATGGALLGAANGSETVLNITSVTGAYLKGTNVTAKGNIDVLAQRLNNVDVEAKGVAAAAGVAVGATYIKVTLSPAVKAETKGNIMAGGRVKVLALYNKSDKDTNTNHEVNIEASGSSGGFAAATGINIELVQSGSVTVSHESGTVKAGTVNGQTGLGVSNAENSSGKDIIYIAAGNTNFYVTAGGKTFGIAGIGGVIASVSDKIRTTAKVGGVLMAEGDVVVQAYHTFLRKNSGQEFLVIEGNAGGLAAAGTAQQLTVTTDVVTTAQIDGSVKAGHDIVLFAGNETLIRARVKGWAVSGFASGGHSYLKWTMKVNALANVTDKAKLYADRNILINSYNRNQKIGYVTASTAAIGGAVSKNEITATDNYTSNVNIGVSGQTTRPVIQAGKDITVNAYAYSWYELNSTAKAGAILALGTAYVQNNVTDQTQVHIWGSTIESRSGDVYIKAYSQVDAHALKGVGGSGGLAAGNTLQIKSDIRQDTGVTFHKVGDLNNEIRTPAGDITIQAVTWTYSDTQATITFSMNGLSFMDALTQNTVNVTPTIDFGSNTVMEANGDIIINALIEKVYANAYTYTKTASVVNTQSRPTAKVSVTGTASIKGTNTKLRAAGLLQLLADASEGADMYIRAYSYGETAGGTGSIISSAESNVKLYGQITMLGDDSEFVGKDIVIEASVPMESSVRYSKEAVYKAYTATEFIKQTVERVTTVVEEVTEKICKWLPWPFNKIIKWIVKTVVKVVRWFEEIIVEKVLQSETDRRESGSYIYGNTIELHGDIYYGSNAPVTITVDASGNIDNTSVKWHKDDGYIYIDSYNSKAMGSLNIRALNGVVKGNVRVHTRSMIDNMTIINRSALNLVIGNLNLQVNEDKDACNYNIYCSDNSKFVMEDVLDVVSEQSPVFRVATHTGASVTYNGDFSYYSAEMIFEFVNQAGDLIFGENVNIGINKLTIINARNVGASNRYWTVDMYVIQKDTDKDVLPTVDITATGDVYTRFTVKKYVEAANEEEKAAVIEANKMIQSLLISNISAGGKVDVYMNPAMLVIGLLISEATTQEYNYTETVLEAEDLDGEVVTEVVQESEDFDRIVYVREETVEGSVVLKYYSDAQCMTEFVHDETYTGRILYVKLVDDARYEGVVNEHYYRDKACGQEIMNVELIMLGDTTGFDNYLVISVDDGQGNVTKTYKKIGSEDFRYVTDPYSEDSWIEVNIDGEFRRLEENEEILYLKLLSDGTYTDIIPVSSYKLVGKDTTYKYYLVDENGGRTELTGYEYFLEDESGWHGYRQVQREAMNTENVYTQNTVMYSYNVSGQYEISDITAGSSILLRAMAMGENETVVVLKGRVETNGESDVTFNGFGHTKLHFNGGSFGGENANVTVQTENVTTEKTGNRSEIFGKTVTVSTTGGFGTEKNPIAVTVNTADGSGFNISISNQGAVYAESYADLYIGILIVPEDQIIWMKMNGYHLYGVNNANKVTAGAWTVIDVKTIGTPAQKLNTVIGNGGFDLTAGDSIYIHQTGNAYVKHIHAANTLDMTTDKNLLNICPDSAAMTAKDFILQAGGRIGTQTTAMIISELSGGSLTAIAGGDIWIENISDELHVKKVVSENGNVSLTTGRNLLNGSQNDEDAVSGQKVLLNAEEGIGTVDTPLTVDAKVINGEAADSIYIDAGICDVEVMLKALLVQIAARTITGQVETAELDAEAEGDINLTVQSMNGGLKVAGLKSKTGGITLTSDATTEILDAEAATDAEITVQNGNLTIRQLIAKQTAVLVAREGSILNGNEKAHEPEFSQIITNRLEMTAGQAIGTADKPMEVKACGDDAVMTLKAGTISGIYIHDGSKELVLEMVSSDEGMIQIQTIGALLNGLPEESTEANVTGKNILIEADSAGTADKPLTTNLVVDKTLPAEDNALIIRTVSDLTAYDIGTEGVLPITEMSSKNGNVDFRAERSTDIHILSAENGSLTMRADGDFTLGNMKAGKVVNVYATGNITGNISGDIYLGNFEAGTSENPKDISLVVTDGSIFNGLEEEASNPVNLKGMNVTLVTQLTEAGEEAGKTAVVGTADKPVVTQAVSKGSLNVESEDSIYLTDVNTEEMPEGSLNIGTLESRKGDIVLVTGTDTKVDRILAENGTVDMTIGGGLTVDDISTEKITLKAEGAIDMTSEGDIVLDEISDDPEGTTVITNLTSINGNVTLTTARDMEVDRLTATERADLTTAGDLTVKHLTLTEEEHSLTVKADGDVDIAAAQKNLHVEDVIVGGKAAISNKSELLIDRLEAAEAELRTHGDLTIGLVDTDVTELVTFVEEGVIDILARGVLVMKEENDGEGETTIKHLESQSGDIRLTTARDTVIESVIAPKDFDVTSEGHLKIDNPEVRGRIDMQGAAIDSVFTGNVNLGKAEATAEDADANYINLTVYGGSLFNALEDGEEGSNIITANLNLNVYGKVPKDSDESEEPENPENPEEPEETAQADIGSSERPLTTQILAGGRADVYADNDIYLTDVNTDETLESTLNIGTLESGDGNIVLVTGTDMKADRILAEKGTVHMTVGGGITVDDIQTEKVTLKAEGAIDMTSEGDIVLDEISDDPEGTTVITNLTSINGNVTLTTARDMEVDRLTATERADLTTAGDLTVKHLTLTEEEHSLTVKADGDVDIAAAQKNLHVEDVIVGGKAAISNKGELLIDRLEAAEAELKPHGNLTIGLVDTNATELVTFVEEGVIDIFARGDLVMREENDGEGETTIKRLESQSGDIRLTTARDTVIESVIAPKDFNVTSEGNLKIDHAEVKGRTDMRGAAIDAVFKEDVNLGKAEATAEAMDANHINLTVCGGSLLNALKEDETDAVNIIANKAELHSEVDIGRIGSAIRTLIGANGKLFAWAEGVIHIEDKGVDGSLILPVLMSTENDVHLKAERDVRIYSLLSDRLFAHISNGALSLNAEEALTLILEGKENHLGDIRVDGDFNVSSVEEIVMDGIIRAESSRFSGMRKLVLQLMASMGDVRIVSLPGEQTEVHIRTTEENEILRFLSDSLEVLTNLNKQVFLFEQILGKLIVENGGGVNVYELYTLAADTTIIGGTGDDTYYIGMMCDENAAEARFKIRKDDAESWMSAGNMRPLIITDRDGKNVYHIQHTMDRVYINGGFGDDTYILYRYYIWNEELRSYVYYTPFGFEIKDLDGENVYIGFPEPSYSLSSGKGVQTGDKRPLTMMVLLMLLSVSAMIGCMKQKRKIL